MDHGCLGSQEIKVTYIDNVTGADLGGGVRWVQTGPKNFYVHIISPFVNVK